MLGIVCEVTIEILPNRKPMRISIESMPLNDFLNRFSDEVARLKSSYDQVFGMMFPNNNRVLWECRKFVDPPSPGLWSLLTALDDPLLRRRINLFKDVLLPLIKAKTTLSPFALLDELFSVAGLLVPTALLGYGSYHINACDRGVVYEETDPDFDFYDWVFPEAQWPDMVRSFVKLIAEFRTEHGFVLPLPTLIYFVKQDKASLLSRSRHANMMAVDPTHTDPTDPNWHQFRRAFNEIALTHGGSPHINKTRDGAIHHFAKSHDTASLKAFLKNRKEMDPKDMFFNDFFKTMFAGLT
jgi:hypothetical protein